MSDVLSSSFKRVGRDCALSHCALLRAPHAPVVFATHPPVPRCRERLFVLFVPGRTLSSVCLAESWTCMGGAMAIVARPRVCVYDLPT